MTTLNEPVQPVLPVTSHLDSGGGSLRTWLTFTVLTFVLGGVLYPVVTTLISGAIFPAQANGSLITRNNQVVGSSLIGQPFSGERYFIGRPSAAGTGYDPTAASGSNLAGSNPALRERVQADSSAIAKREDVTPVQIPADLVTTSGSGLDPHVSPQGAAIQVARVARARNLSVAQVQQSVAAATEPAGLIGQDRVNVLRLNLALDGVQTAK